RVPSRLVELLRLVPPQLGGEALDRVGQPHPGMAARVVTRLRRGRERRVGKRADRDDDQVRLRGLRVEDLGAALGAEVEDRLLPIRLVRDTRVVGEAPRDLHLVGLDPRLHAEGASGPALAGEAAADRDGKRLARYFQPELPAVTGGFTGRHRRET